MSALPSRLAAACLTLFASTVWATSFYARPFPETVQDSPIIVRGHIESSNGDWGRGQDGVRRLYTYYSLEVQEVLKGPLQSSTLSMRELGGQKDGVGMEVAGAAHFQPGEDVVVMLGPRNSDGTYDVRGLMMGKLDVLKNESGSECLDGPALAANASDIHDDDEQGAPSETHSSCKWTMQALRQLIVSQAGGSVAAAPSPSPSPIAAASTLAARSSQQAASQLQPDVPDESAVSQPESEGGRFSPWVRGAFALAALGAGVWVLRVLVFRKKRR